jgi:hypothetical protein
MGPGPHNHPPSQARAPARPIHARAGAHDTPLPPRSRRSGRACAVGQGFVLVTLATLLAGCGRVVVSDPTPDAATTAVCASVMADLPEMVLDQGRRKVEPGVLSAAWGKPAIVLRCGVAPPPGLTPTSECLEVNGVGWYAEEASGGMIFTTIGRPAFVELSVPTAYAPESGALVDVGRAVAAHDPVTTPCAG